MQIKTHQLAQIAGAMLSLAHTGAALATPTFRIDSLGTTATTIEHFSVTGDDRGGLAVSSSRVFVTGDNNTGVFDHSLAVAGPVVSTKRDAMFTNIADQTVWTLGTSATTAAPFLGGVITHVIQLDGTTGELTGNAIAISGPSLSLIGFGSTGIYSGYDRVLLNNRSTGAVHMIDLTDGSLSLIGNVTPSFTQRSAESWAVWGIAEIFGGDQYLTYVRDSTTIERRRIGDNAVSTVASFSNLSDMANFSVAPSEGRWYFHHEGTSQFRSGDETLGFAQASFTVDSGMSAAVPEPTTWAMMLLGLVMFSRAIQRGRQSQGG